MEQDELEFEELMSSLINIGTLEWKIKAITSKHEELRSHRNKIRSLREDAKTLLRDLVTKGHGTAVDKKRIEFELIGEWLNVRETYRGLEIEVPCSVFGVGRDDKDLYALVFDTELEDTPDKIRTRVKYLSGEIYNPEVLLTFVSELLPGIPEETIVKMRKLHTAILEEIGQMSREDYAVRLVDDLFIDLGKVICEEKTEDGFPVAPDIDPETDPQIWLYPSREDLPDYPILVWPYALDTMPEEELDENASYDDLIAPKRRIILYQTIEEDEDGNPYTVQGYAPLENVVYGDELLGFVLYVYRSRR